MRFFVGDIVETPNGTGVVERSIRWIDRIREMDNDGDAVLFSSRCKREVGNNYKEEWGEVIVSIGRKFLVFKSADVVVIKSRGEENDIFKRDLKED